MCSYIKGMSAEWFIEFRVGTMLFVSLQTTVAAREKVNEFRQKVLIISRMSPGTTENTMSFRLRLVLLVTPVFSHETC